MSKKDMRYNRYYLVGTVCPDCRHERIGMIIQSDNDYQIGYFEFKCGDPECGFSRLIPASRFFLSMDNMTLRKEINRQVNILADETGVPPQDIHNEWLAMGNPPQPISSEVDLLKKLDWVEARLQSEAAAN